MKSILINGLLINKQNTGIGNYGLNIIKEFDKNEFKKFNNYKITLLTAYKSKFNNISLINKPYGSSYRRLIIEQTYIPYISSDYDLIHYIDYSSPIISSKKPMIVTIHDLSYYKYPETFKFLSRNIKKRLTPLSISRAAKIIVDSENTREDLLTIFNLDKSKLEVIYPGSPDYKRVTDVSTISDLKNKYNIKGDYILYLGTLEPRKNLVRLIDAYNILKQEGIQEKLVIAGKKGWLYKDIFKRVEKHGLIDQVIFTGYISEDEKAIFYSAAKVFVYPSLYEGFGLPALEAMSCGTAVVVSRNSSMPEVVGDCGVYVQAEDINSIAEGIYKILKDEDLNRKLVKQGLERSSKFSWTKSAERLLEVYRELIG